MRLRLETWIRPMYQHPRMSPLHAIPELLCWWKCKFWPKFPFSRTSNEPSNLHVNFPFSSKSDAYRWVRSSISFDGIASCLQHSQFLMRLRLETWIRPMYQHPRMAPLHVMPQLLCSWKCNIWPKFTFSRTSNEHSNLHVNFPFSSKSDAYRWVRCNISC